MKSAIEREVTVARARVAREKYPSLADVPTVLLPTGDYQPIGPVKDGKTIGGDGEKLFRANDVVITPVESGQVEVAYAEALHRITSKGILLGKASHETIGAVVLVGEVRPLTIEEVRTIPPKDPWPTEAQAVEYLTAKGLEQVAPGSWRLPPGQAEPTAKQAKCLEVLGASIG